MILAIHLPPGNCRISSGVMARSVSSRSIYTSIPHTIDTGTVTYFHSTNWLSAVSTIQLIEAIIEAHTPGSINVFINSGVQYPLLYSAIWFNNITQTPNTAIDATTA